MISATQSKGNTIPVEAFPPKTIAIIATLSISMPFNPAPKKAAAKKSARKPNAAFMALLTVSSTLAEVVGTKPMPRTEIVKKIWDYIKKNGLQDKKNKRMINADEKLKPVFGKGQISMFELAKIVNDQIQK